jgi:hypothetical protein
MICLQESHQLFMLLKIMQEFPHFDEYTWRSGKPVGRQLVPKNSLSSFRVITDPYKKRYSVEKYVSGEFVELVYDSNLFDFRQLKRADEAAWQREVVEESAHLIKSLIRSMDERVILIEEVFFQGNLCHTCRLLSPHGVWIATQKMFHRNLGDAFDGVALFDRLDHPILIKKYAKDASSGEFTTLLSESWEH